jgi:methylated-DNA-protein-cysteine methyltransferase-like protein
MQPFTEKVIGLIAAIPPGRVASYGDIAAAAESPRAARQVVRILHSMSTKYDLPWWRVVNKAGEISLTDEASAQLQQQKLLAEAVEVDGAGRIRSLIECRLSPLELAILVET